MTSTGTVTPWNRLLLDRRVVKLLRMAPSSRTDAPGTWRYPKVSWYGSTGLPAARSLNGTVVGGLADWNVQPVISTPSMTPVA